MTDEKTKSDKFDILVKLIGLLLTLATIICGIWQYNDGRERQLRQPFLTKQLSLYSEVCSLAGTLSTRTMDNGEFKKARMRFWTLYYGELCLFEDQDVAKAVADYGDTLFDYTKTGNDHEVKLQELALALAAECRKSLLKTWGVSLGELPKFRTEIK